MPRVRTTPLSCLATMVVSLAVLASSADDVDGQGPPAPGTRFRAELSGVLGGHVEGRVDWATADSVGLRQNLRFRPDRSFRVSVGEIRRLELSEVTGNQAIMSSIIVGILGLATGRLIDAFNQCPIFSPPGCDSSAGYGTVLGGLLGFGAGALVGLETPAYGPWTEVRPSTWAGPGRTQATLRFYLSFR